MSRKTLHPDLLLAADEGTSRPLKVHHALSEQIKTDGARDPEEAVLEVADPHGGSAARALRWSAADLVLTSG